MGLTQVSTDGVKNDAITKTKIPANQIEASELADNAVDTNAISNDAVTFDKIENVAQNVFLGRLNSGNGNIEPLSATQTRTLLNVANGATNSPTTIINNNADNRVITGSGTANTLNGESSVVIDANGKLGIGTTSPEEILHIKGASETVNSRDGVMLQHNTDSDDADNGLPLVWSGRTSSTLTNYGIASICGRKENSGSGNQAAYLQFATCNSVGSLTEKMRIDSSGDVGIGLTNISDFYSKDLVVKAASEGGITIRNTNSGDWNYIMFASGDSGSARYDSYIGVDHGNNKVRISTNESVAAKNVELRSDGNFHISDGNLHLASGHGIDFSADGNASGNTSELLHDYEEGTWSVTSLNYDYDGNQAQRGHYIKVGRVVHAFFRVKFHTQTNYTGQHLRFTGLPFTSASGSPYDFNVCGIAHGYGSVDFFRVYIQPGSTYAYWYTSTGNNFNNSTSLNNADIRGCITYTASA